MTVAAALLVVILEAAALGGQAPATPAQTQPSPPDGGTVTATGCLRGGDEAGSFVLEKVTWAPATSGSPAGPAAHHDASPQRDRPTTPATAAAGQRDVPASGETIRLAGAATKLKLGDHVGHTVTVTGMLAPRDPIVRPGIVLPDPAPAGDTTSRTAAAAASKEPTGQRVLNVRSITHVAKGCK